MKLTTLLGFTRQEMRGSRGRLIFFVGCLAVGVGAVVGVAGLVDGLNATLRDQARDLLSADLVVSGRRALPDHLDQAFAGLEFERTDVQEMPTLVRAPAADGAGSGRSQLVELRVIEGRFPLAGTVELTPDEPLEILLGSGGVVVAPEVLRDLRLELGDNLLLGGQPFPIAGVIEAAPDRLDFSMATRSRILAHPEVLERAGLVSFGSRIRFQALYLLPELSRDELRGLKERLVKSIPGVEYLRIETYADGQPTVRRALQRFEEYLGLVALLSLILGGIGVAQVVRTWMATRTPSIAILRCLGVRPGEILILYLANVVFLSALGSALGGILGLALPQIVPAVMPDLVAPGSFSGVSAAAVGRGVLLGVGIAILFSLPPLTAVWRVAPARVFRSDVRPLAVPIWLLVAVFVAQASAVFGSAILQTGGKLGVSSAFTAGLFVVWGLLLLGARVAMALAARLPHDGWHPVLRHGLAALARPGAGTLSSVAALGLGITVVFGLALVEDRLSSELAQALPAEAPSAFLWDVQPDQWPVVEKLLEDEGGRTVQSVPVVMARLLALNGRPVSELINERSDGPRARWLFTREQRITWFDPLPTDNVIVEGELWSDPERPELSLEEGFARNLGATVGSTLRLDIQGVPMDFVVSSLRRVEWRSFSINFFLMAEPGVLDAAPQFRLAGVRLDASREQAIQDRLAAEVPNVVMLRVRPILDQVLAILEKLALGVSLLGSFTIITGVVILAGAISATMLRRSQETALLKTLGVTPFGIASLFVTEYTLIGLLAGSIGAAAGFALAFGFLEHVMDLPARLPWSWGIAVTLLGAVLAVLSGLAASGRALAVRPIESLRGS